MTFSLNRELRSTTYEHKDKGFDRKYLQRKQYTSEVHYLFPLSDWLLQICLQTCLKGINASLIVWEFFLSC